MTSIHVALRAGRALALLVVLTAGFSGCTTTESSDKNGQEKQAEPSPGSALTGKWVLVQRYGGSIPKPTPADLKSPETLTFDDKGTVVSVHDGTTSTWGYSVTKGPVTNYTGTGDILMYSSPSDEFLPVIIVEHTDQKLVLRGSCDNCPTSEYRRAK